MAKELRVLHIHNSMSVGSGVMSVVMNYYREIVRYGIQFDFLYYHTADETCAPCITELGGRVSLMEGGRNPLLLSGSLRDFLRTAQGEYDVVHIHDAYLARFFYGILKAAGVQSVVVHSHATCFGENPASSLRNRILCRGVQRFGDALFACSDAAGKFMFGNNQYRVINNAINVEPYAFSNEKREKLRRENGLMDAFVVGHAGGFRPQKNHLFLIDVFSAVLKVEPRSVLLLAGDGPLKGEVEKRVDDLSIGQHVRFLGNRSDLSSLYQAMDCFVLPSLFEGLPMVGIEAQCSGLPVLASDCVTSEMNMGYCDFLSLKDGPSSWAKRVLGLRHFGLARRLGAEKVSDKGFNVRLEAPKLAETYNMLSGNI